MAKSKVHWFVRWCKSRQGWAIYRGRVWQAITNTFANAVKFANRLRQFCATNSGEHSDLTATAFRAYSQTKYQPNLAAWNIP